MFDDHIVVEQRSKRLEVFRARLGVLFDRLPMLCGFHVADDLSLTEITIEGLEGATPYPLLEEICSTLEDVVADSPDGSIDLLRGTTFARSVH